MVVVGGGAMGTGIALVAAQAGLSVTLVEPDPAAHARIAAAVAKHVARASDSAIGMRVTVVAALPSGLDAGLAIEAVPENLELKRAVIGELAAALPSDALLATNTSSLSVEDIMATVPAPERTLGLHFFNPPTAMRLVEIVPTSQTGDAQLQRAREYVELFGKTGVEAADTPGFIVNRVARPFYLQAMAALEREVGTIDDLDALARGAGFAMGPFELMDFIGLDVNLATSESIYERTEAARLQPNPLQRDLIAQGRLGRKSGVGFYDYSTPETSPRGDLPIDAPAESERNGDEIVALLGLASLGDDVFELLTGSFDHVVRIENEDDVSDVSPETTIAIDLGDGASDRTATVLELDRALPPDAAIFVDAYATDLKGCLRRMRHPERLVGYGILGSLDRQRVIEIVDTQVATQDVLSLAQELFEGFGHATVLVADDPGLFLGRLIGSIVNEAVIAVEEEIATPDDIDTAMRLGVNYPLGPIAWGREIGGARIARILRALAKAEGDAFAPSRALWVLDVEGQEQQQLEEAIDA